MYIVQSVNFITRFIWSKAFHRKYDICTKKSGVLHTVFFIANVKRKAVSGLHRVKKQMHYLC